MTLDVNGLESKLNLNYLDCFLSKYDFICLQETNTDNPANFVLSTALHNHKVHVKTKSNKGYKLGGIHGLYVLVKNELFKFTEVIENTESECVLWLKISKDVIGVEFILGEVYIASEGSVFHDKEFFDHIENDMLFFKNVYDLPVCMMGDFNSRTSTLDDFLELEDETSDATGMHENVNIRNEVQKMSIKTDRFNVDGGTNNDR